MDAMIGWNKTNFYEGIGPEPRDQYDNEWNVLS